MYHYRRDKGSKLIRTNLLENNESYVIAVVPELNRLVSEVLARQRLLEDARIELSRTKRELEETKKKLSGLSYWHR